MQTRRDFLRKVSITAVAGLIPAPILSAVEKKQVPLSDKFKLGIASADATSDSIILWTYYEGFYPLKVCVWTEDKKGIWADAHRGDGGFVIVKFEGLSSYKRYRYAFSEIGFAGSPIGQSHVGYFKTAPASDDLIPLRFGAVSCVKNLYNVPLLEQASRENLDFFIFNGDNSYNDGMDTLNEFRDSWAKTLTKKGCLDLRASMSIIATIDDHDVENNFDVETINPGKLEAALQAFFEHMPIRRHESESNRIWRQLSWGKTLDIFVLDCRTERKPSRRQYISREQMHWLKEGILSSQSMFKIILNSVPISEFSLPMSQDRWEGFPEQRAEILNFIDSHMVSNLLWVSGDFHFTSLGKVSKFGAGSSQMEVLAGPGAQLSNPAGYALKFSSQYDWVHVANSYITVDCDVGRERMHVTPHFLN